MGSGCGAFNVRKRKKVLLFLEKIDFFFLEWEDLSHPASSPPQANVDSQILFRYSTLRKAIIVDGGEEKKSSINEV